MDGEGAETEMDGEGAQTEMDGEGAQTSKQTLWLTYYTLPF